MRREAKKRVLGIFAVVVGEISVLQNFCKIIKNPKVWWKPIMKKFKIIKSPSIYKLAKRPANVNIIRSK